MLEEFILRLKKDPTMLSMKSLSNLQKNLLILSIVILSIFFVTLFWSKIFLPFYNITESSGILVENQFSPNNDLLRYVIYVLTPILVFYISNLFIKKGEFMPIKDLFLDTNLKKNIFENNFFIIFIALFFVILIFVEFFSLDLPNFIIDPLHDGDYLTPAQNYLTNEKIWLSSYTVHGGSNVFYPIFMWKIFGIESIGAYRTFWSFLILFVKLSCVLLSYQITKISSLKDSTKILFFTIFCFLLVSMSHYNVPLNYSYFSFRDLGFILFIVFSLELFTFSRARFLSLIILTLISSVSILFHIDIGIYLGVGLLFLIFYSLVTKKYNNVLLILIFLFVWWSLIIYFIGQEEFFAFFDHAKTIILSVDYQMGSIYPEPFFSIGDNPHGARATRGLLLQITAGIFVLYNVLNKNSSFSNQQKLFFVFLFFLSFVMYKNALNRSDSYHIRMSSDLPILINAFFILRYILIKIERFSSPNKNIYFALIFMTFLIFTNQFNLKMSNIKNLKNNYYEFINLDDNNFLDTETKNLINFYSHIAKDEKCVQNFTDDLAIPFLLKKPTCTKYFASWLASPKKIQIDYVKKLEIIKPKYILYRSDKYVVDGIEVTERLNIVNSFILDNYKLFKSFDGYEIFIISD